MHLTFCETQDACPAEPSNAYFGSRSKAAIQTAEPFHHIHQLEKRPFHSCILLLTGQGETIKKYNPYYCFHMFIIENLAFQIWTIHSLSIYVQYVTELLSLLSY